MNEPSHYGIFELDVMEEKLEYTKLHEQYGEAAEGALMQALAAVSVSEEAFGQVAARVLGGEGVNPDVEEYLRAMTDFNSFRPPKPSLSPQPPAPSPQPPAAYAA